MNLKNLFLPLVFLCVCSMAVQAQDTPRNWAIKTGLGGAFFNNFSLEAERAIGGNKSLYLRGALGNPVIRTDTFGFDRFYFKAGMRFYLGQDKESEGLGSGFFLAPEAVFMYQFDSKRTFRASTGKDSEHSLGAILNFGYAFQIGKRSRIEPFLGIGYVPTWVNYEYLDDVTFEVEPSPWSYIPLEEKETYYNSHFSILGSGAVSMGVNLSFLL